MSTPTPQSSKSQKPPLFKKHFSTVGSASPLSRLRRSGGALTPTPKSGVTEQNNNNTIIVAESPEDIIRQGGSAGNPIKLLALSAANTAKLPPIRVDFGGPLSCEVDVRSPSHFTTASKKDLAKLIKAEQEKVKQQEEEQKKLQNRFDSTPSRNNNKSPSSFRRAGSSASASSFRGSASGKFSSSTSNTAKRKPSPSSSSTPAGTVSKEVIDEQRSMMEADDVLWEERRHLINSKLYDFGPQAPIFKKLFLAEDIKTRAERLELSRAKRRKEHVLEGRVDPPKEMPSIPEEVAKEVGLREVIEIEKEQWMRVAQQKQQEELEKKKMTSGRLQGGIDVDFSSTNAFLGPSPSRTRYVEAIRFMKECEKRQAEEERQRAEDEEKRRMMKQLKEVNMIDLNSIESPQHVKQNHSSDEDEDDEEEHYTRNVLPDFTSSISSPSSSPNHKNEQQQQQQTPSSASRQNRKRHSSLHATFVENLEEEEDKNEASMMSASGGVRNDSFFNASSSQLKDRASKSFTSDQGIHEVSSSGEDDDDDAGQQSKNGTTTTQSAGKSRDTTNRQYFPDYTAFISPSPNGGENQDHHHHHPHFKSPQEEKEESLLKDIMGSNFKESDSDDSDAEEEVDVVSHDGKVTRMKKLKKEKVNHKEMELQATLDSGTAMAASINFLSAARSGISNFNLNNPLYKEENREVFGEFAEEILELHQIDEQNRVEDDDDGAYRATQLPETYSAMVSDLLRTVHLGRDEAQKRGLARTMQTRGCQENVKRRIRGEIRMKETQLEHQQSLLHSRKPVMTHRERQNQSILESALNDLNRVSDNAYIDEVTDKAIFFRHALMSERHYHHQHQHQHQHQKSDKTEGKDEQQTVNHHHGGIDRETFEKGRALTFNSHEIRRQHGNMSALFTDRKGPAAAALQRQKKKMEQQQEQMKQRQRMLGMAGNSASTQNDKNSKYYLSPTQVVNSMYFNPSRLRQHGKIPVGTALEIGGQEFLYDEAMRM